MVQTAGLRTDEGVGDGDLQPHPVSDLQPRLRIGHRLDDSRHVTVDVQVVLLIDSWKTAAD